MKWDRQVEERQWWTELRELADKKDIQGFYSKYAQYLEWNNVISPQRELLYKMAKMVADDISI
jgi:hypothetical protein